MDPWECDQSEWLPTRQVLEHIQEVVTAQSGGRDRIKLLCGADLLETFATPGLWSSEDVREYSLVVIVHDFMCGFSFTVRLRRLLDSLDLLSYLGLVIMLPSLSISQTNCFPSRSVASAVSFIFSVCWLVVYQYCVSYCV